MKWYIPTYFLYYQHLVLKSLAWIHPEALTPSTIYPMTTLESYSIFPNVPAFPLRCCADSWPSVLCSLFLSCCWWGNLETFCWTTCRTGHRQSIPPSASLHLASHHFARWCHRNILSCFRRCMTWLQSAPVLQPWQHKWKLSPWCLGRKHLINYRAVIFCWNSVIKPLTHCLRRQSIFQVFTLDAIMNEYWNYWNKGNLLFQT